jgi:drug/metabolite transporter (DMT)-like permease
MTTSLRKLVHPGVAASLGAAVLFGGAAPLAKLLLAEISPWLLAALLYLGSGIGLAAWRALRHAPAVRLGKRDAAWLAGAVCAGGIAGPVLLMAGLAALPAGTASLLLNAEAVFTALLAWVVFRENVDRRVALGMLAIVAGGVVLAWPQDAQVRAWPAMLLVLGACLAWGVDNNLTRKVALADASWIAMVKGLVAGSCNLAIALSIGATWPPAGFVLAAGVLGLVSYGASLVLFVVGLRQLGTARTGAYFSVGPFFGAGLAVLLLGEPATPRLLLAGVLMAGGVWLHLSERHEHVHAHEAMDHTHEHVHGGADEHHDHRHTTPVPPGTSHSHPHHHEPLTHSHPHYPDAHHRHGHGGSP